MTGASQRKRLTLWLDSVNLRYEAGPDLDNDVIIPTESPCDSGEEYQVVFTFDHGGDLRTIGIDKRPIVDERTPAEKIIHDIREELKFDVSLASTLRSTLYRLQYHPIVRAVINIVNSTPGVGDELFQRAQFLTTKPVEEGYSHPDDLELTCYVYILAVTDPDSYMDFVRRVSVELDDRVYYSSVAVAKHMYDNYVNK